MEQYTMPWWLNVLKGAVVGVSLTENYIDMSKLNPVARGVISSVGYLGEGVIGIEMMNVAGAIFYPQIPEDDFGYGDDDDFDYGEEGEE